MDYFGDDFEQESTILTTFGCFDDRR